MYNIYMCVCVKGGFLPFFTNIGNKLKMFSVPAGLPALMVCALYGALPPQEQLRVFQPAPPGTRKASRYIRMHYYFVVCYCVPAYHNQAVS